MRPRTKTGLGLFLSCGLLVSSALPAASGQTGSPQNQPTAAQQDEVLRISTALIQTDVIVLDKKGRFVSGLPKEQFELVVDGQPQDISFFESVEAGSLKEAAQLASARGGDAAKAAGSSSASPIVRPTAGRSFIFFVDDFHLSPEGVARSKDLLNNFIKSMGEDDQALLMSPSGQIGFLQQLTDNKAALKLAASRIKYQAVAQPQMGRRAMTVYEALAIDRNQRNIIDYKTKEYMDDMGLTRAPEPQAVPRSSTGGAVDAPRSSSTNMDVRKMSAEAAVKGEARNVLLHANNVSEALLGSLEYVVRGAGTLTGRKLFFFISDGFVLDTRSGKNSDRLHRVLDTAARSGVAIYTVDSRGLTAGNVGADKDVFSDIAIGVTGGDSIDASTDATSVSYANDSATKEILRTLAFDTGGRPILNRNDLESGVNQILRETESYYVLAWRPQGGVETASKPKFSTMKVALKGRPDLKVLARSGFFNSAPPPLPSDTKNTAPTKDSKDAKAPPLKPSEMELRAAISSAFPRRQLGVSTYTTYSNEIGDAYKIITFADLSNYGVAPGAAGAKPAGEVDFYVAVLNDAGKSVASVGQKVSISESSAQPYRIVATLPNALPPGLYQVRTAARDAQTGRVGSAFQWLEIPKLKAGELALSNLLLAEVSNKPGDALALDVERRFARTSSMLIQMFVYHAARASGGTGAPDATVTLQVFQNGKQLVAAPPQPLPTAGVADPSRLQYGSEIPLASFPPGRYKLQVTVNDRVAKTTASQQLTFTVE